MHTLKETLLIALALFCFHVNASNNDDDTPPAPARAPLVKASDSDDNNTRPPAPTSAQPTLELVPLNTLASLSLFAKDHPVLVESLKKDALIQLMGMYSGNMQEFCEHWSYELKALDYITLANLHVQGRFNGLFAEGSVYWKSVNISENDLSAQKTWTSWVWRRQMPVMRFAPKGSLPMKVLNISSNGLVSLKGLSTLTNLESLDISGNSLSRIPDIEYLTNLTRLCASNNPLTDMQLWFHLKKLQTLLLEDTLLKSTDISGLSYIISLRTLDLDRNKFITYLPDLRNLTLLERLSLLRTPIENLQGLRDNTSLTRLSLSSDRMKISEITQTLNAMLFNIKQEASFFVDLERQIN